MLFNEYFDANVVAFLDFTVMCSVSACLTFDW